MQFIHTINNIPISFQTQWDDYDGEGWEFGVTIDVPCTNMPHRQSNDLRDYVSVADIKSTLLWLDEKYFHSAVTPIPQIGNVEHSILKLLSEQLEKIRLDTMPSVSASDSYYGV